MFFLVKYAICPKQCVLDLGCVDARTRAHAWLEPQHLSKAHNGEIPMQRSAPIVGQGGERRKWTPPWVVKDWNGTLALLAQFVRWLDGATRQTVSEGLRWATCHWRVQVNPGGDKEAKAPEDWGSPGGARAFDAAVCLVYRPVHFLCSGVPMQSMGWTDRE